MSSVTADPARTTTASFEHRRAGTLVRRFLTQVFPREAAGRRVPLGDEPVVLGREPGPAGYVLDDREASRRHAEVRPVPVLDCLQVEDLESKNGTYLNGAAVKAPEHLASGGVLRIGGALFVYSELEIPPVLAAAEFPSTLSPARALAQHLIDRAAPSDYPVLIAGPTGSGKELLARRLHASSGCRGELVTVNCATFSRELLASELFGHVRGAFSGAAAARAGLFVAASNGTLFLDEVAELPLDQQPALLRAIQERRIRPVGSDREQSVNVRLVAATHRELNALVDAGAFRADLYARLAAFPVRLPGLTECREDILPIFENAIGDACPPLTLEAAEALLRYDWPYNIRELQHAAANLRLLAPAVDAIDLSLLPSGAQRAMRPPPGTSDAVLSRLTAEQLGQLLGRHGGNVAGAARELGVSRQKLYRILEAVGVEPGAARGR